MTGERRPRHPGGRGRRSIFAPIMREAGPIPDCYNIHRHSTALTPPPSLELMPLDGCNHLRGNRSTNWTPPETRTRVPGDLRPPLAGPRVVWGWLGIERRNERHQPAR